MKEHSTPTAAPSSSVGERIEEVARDHIQRFIQALLEEEVTELLGRKKAARRVAIDAPEGYRNGYGRPRKLAMLGGTITVRRPRVRGLTERLISRVLPLFQRRTKQGGELLPPVIPAWPGAGRLRVGAAGPLG